MSAKGVGQGCSAYWLDSADLAAYDRVSVTSAVIRYGELSEVPVGSVFPSRRALRDAGVHRPLQAGIDFAAGQAASSVVLSGVYPDDDQGDVVIYTGQGGLQPGTSKAIADQKPILGNAGNEQRFVPLSE